MPRPGDGRGSTRCAQDEITCPVIDLRPMESARSPVRKATWVSGGEPRIRRSRARARTLIRGYRGEVGTWKRSPGTQDRANARPLARGYRWSCRLTPRGIDLRSMHRTFQPVATCGGIAPGRQATDGAPRPPRGRGYRWRSMSPANSRLAVSTEGRCPGYGTRDYTAGAGPPSWWWPMRSANQRCQARPARTITTPSAMRMAATVRLPPKASMISAETQP